MSEFNLVVPTTKVKQLTPIDKEELVGLYGRSTLLHISPNKDIRKFTPMISNRGLGSEDRTIPRVSTSTTLTHCIAGAGHVDGLFNSDGFDGVFQIYAFEPEVAFKPNTELVKDATQNNELWLLSYSKETEEYKPTKVGQFFIHSIMSMRRLRRMIFTMYVQVNKGETLALTKKIVLKEGFWKIVGENTMGLRKSHGMRKPLTVLECGQVDQSEYMEHKENQSVSLEGIGVSKIYNW